MAAGCGLAGPGRKAARVGAGVVLHAAFASHQVDIALGCQRVLPVGRHPRAADGDVPGALQFKVAIRMQVAGDQVAVTAHLMTLVVDQREELAVLVMRVAAQGVLHAVDHQRAAVADHAGLGAATHLAGADMHRVGLDNQLAVGIHPATRMQGLALVSITLAAEKAAAHQVAGVMVAAAALAAAGTADRHIPRLETDIPGACQFGACQLQRVTAGQFQALARLEAAGNTALIVAAVVPVLLPQVFAMAALIAGFMGLGGSRQAQAGAAVDAQLIARLDTAGLDQGVARRRQPRIVPGLDPGAMLARVAITGGAVKGLVGHKQGLVLPLFVFLLQGRAFQAAQGQVATGIKAHVAAADIGPGQAQVTSTVQFDIALMALHHGAAGVQAVGVGLAADHQITGRTDTDPLGARHLPRADMHTRALGGADDIDAPGLHRTEQAGVDTRRAAICRRINLAHLAAGGVDAIAPHHQIQAVTRSDRPLAVDLWGNQPDGPVRVAQATPLHLQLPTRRTAVQGLQGAIGHVRAAHHQAGVASIDKPTPIDRNPVGVGQYIIGLAPEHLLAAVEGRGLGADHFIKDHAGSLAVKLRVARQLPGQLGLTSLQGIVEHRTLAIDVVIEELIV